MVGVLPEPIGYSTVWPDLNSLTEEEQAAVSLKRTEAMAKYVQGSVEALVAPMDYLVRVMGMTQEEAEAIVAAALQALPLLPDDEDDEVGQPDKDENEAP